MSDNNPPESESGENFVFEGGDDFAPFTGDPSSVKKEDDGMPKAPIPLDTENNPHHKELVMQLRREMDVLYKEIEDKIPHNPAIRELVYLNDATAFPQIQLFRDESKDSIGLVGLTDVFNNRESFIRIINSQSTGNPKSIGHQDLDPESYQLDLPIVLDRDMQDKIDEYKKTHPDFDYNNETRFLLSNTGKVRKITMLNPLIESGEGGYSTLYENTPYERDLEHIGLGIRELQRQLRGEERPKVKMIK